MANRNSHGASAGAGFGPRYRRTPSSQMRGGEASDPNQSRHRHVSRSSNDTGNRGARGMVGMLKDAVLHLLSHHERLLLVLWYAERMTPAEVALTLDLTEQQALSMHGAVLAKLRAAAA